MECEICGVFSENLNQKKVDGSVLLVCSNCANQESVWQQTNQFNQTNSNTFYQNSKREKFFALNQKPFERVYLVKNFGSKIKQAREKQNLTIEQLASKLKEKASYLQRIESGSVRPEDKTLFSLEKILKISLREKPEE